MTSTRPSREETYMEVAHVIRRRSTCERGQVGGIAVMGGRIIAQGYNGSPPGAPHCTELGCIVDPQHPEAGCQRTIHCEANLIAFAARHGISLEGAVLYCTAGPCLKCAQLIASAGFDSLVFEHPYRRPEGLELLDALSIPTYMWDANRKIKLLTVRDTNLV
jgi:dCMP deaminase